MHYILTNTGKEKVDWFIKECAAKRKEILDAGIDTAYETELPTEKDIVSDLNCGVGVDEDGDYYNGYVIDYAKFFIIKYHFYMIKFV